MQGCSLGCPGCFNPATHRSEATQHVGVDEVLGWLQAEGGRIEGLTLSGGEPFEQPQGVLALLREVRTRTSLSTLAFSGYTLEEIRAQPCGADLLANLDVLIDGRYVAPQRLGRGLRGSSNQRIHLLSNRYDRAAVEATPEAEIHIDAAGNLTLTGVSPLKVR